MKKYLILLFIMICAFLFSQNAGQVKWGMSKDEVKGIETAKLVRETDDTLIYTENLNNGKDEFTVIYRFENNSMVYTGYYTKFENDKDNFGRMHNLFVDYKGLFEKEYGQAGIPDPFFAKYSLTKFAGSKSIVDINKDLNTFLESTLQDSFIESKINSGFMYLLNWAFDDTHVSLFSGLNPNDKKLHFFVLYTSKLFDEVLKQKTLALISEDRENQQFKRIKRLTNLSDRLDRNNDE